MAVGQNIQFGAPTRADSGSAQHIPRRAIGRDIPLRLPHPIPVRAKVMEWMDASTGDSGNDPARVLNEIQRLLTRGK
jgi:hypothetical protein